MFRNPRHNNQIIIKSRTFSVISFRKNSHFQIWLDKIYYTFKLPQIRTNLIRNAIYFESRKHKIQGSNRKWFVMHVKWPKCNIKVALCSIFIQIAKKKKNWCLVLFHHVPKFFWDLNGFFGSCGNPFIFEIDPDFFYDLNCCLKNAPIFAMPFSGISSKNSIIITCKFQAIPQFQRKHENFLRKNKKLSQPTLDLMIMTWRNFLVELNAKIQVS